MTQPNDATPRPSVCKDDHPLTWKSGDLAFCTDRRTASTEPVIRFWAWEDGELVAIDRHEFISIGFWEVQVGSLLNTADPATAAERLRALIVAARRIEQHWFSPAGLADPPGTESRLAVRLRTALAPLKETSE